MICWRFISMNGIKPSFLKCDINKETKKEEIFYTDKLSVSSDFYYGELNPYTLPPSCNVNLIELSRYAQKIGKKIIELSQEEISKFAI